jgi:hypothetical protein
MRNECWDEQVAREVSIGCRDGYEWKCVLFWRVV